MGTDDGRLIAEIRDFLEGKPVSRAAPDPIPTRTARRHRRRSVGMRSKARRRRGVLVLVVLIGVAIAWRHGSFTPLDWPSPPGGVVDRSSTAPAGPGYSFLRLNPSGSPVRWNPCQAVHYRTNLTEAPPNAALDLAGAIARVSEATGLRFVDDGSTTVIPRSSYGVDAHMQAKPAVIAWATSAQTDGLGRSGAIPGLFTTYELGRGGAAVLIDPASHHGVAVSGSVVIDTDTSSSLQPGFGPSSLGVVLMHELGHMVGLGHVNDPNDIMNPTVSQTAFGTWSAGDRAGLARLGALSGCLTVPRSRTFEIY